MPPPSSSSTTVEEDPQSLWQSSSPARARGGRGGGSDCRTGVPDIFGPLKDSTVLLWQLLVGRCCGRGPGWWCFWRCRRRWGERPTTERGGGAAPAAAAGGKLVLALGPRRASAATS